LERSAARRAAPDRGWQREAEGGGEYHHRV